MRAGTLTSVELTKFYLARIAALDQSVKDGGVNAIIELNPDALAMAQNADQLRRRGTVLGPLHGIPVLLKDNIDTGDSMQTSAGSLSLVGRPPSDSTIAENLRAGGAVILGKTNLSEWANFRSFESTSGWSGRGGQTNNPVPRSIAIRAAPAPAQARPLRPTLPLCRWGAKRTAASFVRVTRMV